MPQDIIKNKAQLLDNILYRLQNSFESKFTLRKNRLEFLKAKIDSFNVENVLKRGFVIVKQENKIVPRKSSIKKNTELKLKFYDGEVGIKND